MFDEAHARKQASHHATLDLADVNGDGALDIVVGNFFVGYEGLPWIEVWENLRKKK